MVGKTRKKPSKQLVASAGAGAVLGPLLEVGLHAFGVPVPPGTGAAVGGLVTALAHYLQGHGRAQ